MLISKLNEEAIIPRRKNPTDAGLDLYALNHVYILGGSFAIVKTGITIEIPKGFMGLIMPKSRNNHLVGAGVVDQDYQGEILVKVVNYSNEVMEIFPAEAIAQLVLIPVITPEVEPCGINEIHKEKTVRGSSGGIVEQVK